VIGPVTADVRIELGVRRLGPREVNLTIGPRQVPASLETTDDDTTTLVVFGDPDVGCGPSQPEPACLLFVRGGVARYELAGEAGGVAMVPLPPGWGSADSTAILGPDFELCRQIAAANAERQEDGSEW
jgi:hypothetical protein